MLGSLVGVLAVVYALTVVFDPERVNTRSASYAWLDAKAVSQADSVYIKGADGEVTLMKKDGSWFVADNGRQYPAKDVRIADLVGLLSKKADYPVRSSDVASHERLGLVDGTAKRIFVKAGTTTLLDLLVGDIDASGSEVYLRKSSQNQVRSGTDALLSYLSSGKTAWYNLRLLSDTEKITLDSVQRILITPPPAEAVPPTDAASSGTVALSPPPAPFILTRSNGGWTLSGGASGAPAEADTPKTESYIRAILDAAGDDFAPQTDASMQSIGRIVLELGNGTNRVINVWLLPDGNKRAASVSSSAYTYTLASWTLDRLFRDESYFKK
jgi:hypothetical protein